jgi:Alcohol dehydrogenase GroES-like domain
MRAAGITALGEPVEIFEVDELATPAAGEVLIDVAAAGIGNWDELVRIGSWQIGGPAPMALGTEAAGTVAAAGSGVAELREGDEVMTHPLPLRRHGTWRLYPNATGRSASSQADRRDGLGGVGRLYRDAGADRSATNAVVATVDLQGRLPRQPSSNTGLYRIRWKGLRTRFSQTGGDRATPG